MRITIGHLKEILEQIQALNPRLEPGHVQPSEYVTEEVRVFEGENGLQVQMNNDNLPNLFISNQYRQLLNDPDTPKDVKDYVKEKIRAGVFMINSIIQRQTTIRKIVMAIVSVQEDFFKYGMDHLKPLIMAQVAKQVGVHETTVSRAVAGKYLRCKYGLLSLRQFFSTGYQANDGRLVSNTVVKQTIRQLIDEEDGAKPLSDSQIAKMLNEQGYKVVRRTVAKYRENMGILASNLRRQY
jgi:RNA polymerase sigma-54 factor